MSMMNVHKEFQRVITFLTRQQVDFLDKVSKDALFSRGHKLSRSKLISILVNILSDLNINGVGISCKKDLAKRILDSAKNFNHNSTMEVMRNG